MRIRRAWTMRALLACVTTFGCFVAASAAGATTAFGATAVGAPATAPAPVNPISVPTPANDPFYTQPESFGQAQPGQVLKDRRVTVTALPTNTAYQVQYVSENTVGTRQADVATIILPTKPSASPKLVAYDPAIDSLSSSCDPSYQLRNGTEQETGVIAILLSEGWTVVVPDFLGPDNQWAAGYVEARGTLDAVRAAENFGPSRLDGSSTPVGLTGYSGGARGSEFANELAAAYAPELNIVGAASGGLAANISDVMSEVNGGVFSGIYFAALFGLDRAYPALDINSLLTARGKQMEASISTMCLVQYVPTYAFQTMQSYTVNQVNPLTEPAFIKVNSELDAGNYGTPKAPSYIYIASNDELVVPANVDTLVGRYCAEGLKVEYVKIPGEHASTLVTGFPGAVAWLASRFAGEPAPSTCGLPGHAELG